MEHCLGVLSPLHQPTGISPGNDPSSLLVKDILGGMLGWESCEDVGLMTGPGPVYYNLMMLRHSHLADCPA